MCDHRWMAAFRFHASDAYLFDRELFRLFEIAQKRGSSHPTRLCQGTYGAGTACDNCERCREEMRQLDEIGAQLRLYRQYHEARKSVVVSS